MENHYPPAFRGRVKLAWRGPMWHWRGPAPHYFVSVPDDLCAALKDASKLVTYGWGMIPVSVGIGELEYDTSLFPKDGGYLVPIRADVRRAEGLEEGDELIISLELRAGKAARATRRRT